MTYSMLRSITVALLALPLAACDGLLGPLFSADLIIRGPDRLIGVWRDASPWEGVPAGFRCEPRLTIEARGDRDHHRHRHRGIVWDAMTIRRYDRDGLEMGRPLVYTGQRLDWMLGSLHPGQKILTDRIPVVADRLPYRWRMELTYYDPRSGHNGSGRFSSRCVDVH